MKEITPNGTELQIATDDEFVSVISGTESTEYRTQQQFAQDELPFGVNLYARVRHTSDETGYSKWSDVVNFHVEVPAQIVGICVDTAAASPSVSWIDMDGNRLENPDLSKHPVFQNITMATLDSQRSPVTMTKFPRFYIKTAVSGPVASFSEGKTCWWISDMPFEGFRVHPAFKRLTTRGDDGKYQTSDYCYIATYCGHTESVGGKTCLGSKKGATIATGSSSTTRSNLFAYCKNRNNDSAGETGWRPFDIYDVSLLRFLGAIWKGTFDFQKAYGTNTSSSPRAGATKCRIVFRGTQDNPTVWIDDLWNCYWQHVDLFSSSSGRVSLTSPMDLSSSISLGGSSSTYTMATSSGYIKTFCSTSMVIGDESHDLLEFFLPKTVVSSESAASIPDYHNYSTDTSYMKIGGYWSSSNPGGVFSDDYINEYYQESYQSWEVVDYEEVGPGGWSRECGYRFYSNYDTYAGEWFGYVADTSPGGFYAFDALVATELRCNCPQKYGPYTSDDVVSINKNIYTAVCQYSDWIDPSNHDNYYNNSSSAEWVRTHTCPKGWGKYHDAPESGTEPYVQCAQGYIPNGYEKPIYGYVTRYRDAYRNYYSTRCSRS